MGCDIHLYMEYKNPRWKTDQWDAFSSRISANRNYSLFGFLGGVRGIQTPVSSPRGLPSDLSWAVSEDYYLYIDDDADGQDYGRSISFATAMKYASYGCIIENDKDGKPFRVAHPDWHTPSWLNYGEYVSTLSLCDIEYSRYIKQDLHPQLADKWHDDILTNNISYKALARAMEKFEKVGISTRVVFWFDN